MVRPPPKIFESSTSTSCDAPARALAVDLQRGLFGGAAVEGDACEGEVARAVEHDGCREAARR